VQNNSVMSYNSVVMVLTCEQILEANVHNDKTTQIDAMRRKRPSSALYLPPVHSTLSAPAQCSVLHWVQLCRHGLWECELPPSSLEPDGYGSLPTAPAAAPETEPWPLGLEVACTDLENACRNININWKWNCYRCYYTYQMKLWSLIFYWFITSFFFLFQCKSPSAHEAFR